MGSAAVIWRYAEISRRQTCTADIFLFDKLKLIVVDYAHVEAQFDYMKDEHEMMTPRVQCRDQKTADTQV